MEYIEPKIRERSSAAIFMKKEAESLKLENDKYFHSDFIGKFIILNKISFRVLKLKNIHFANGIEDLLSELKHD